ncbi:hypothetical protein Trydic_g3068 [Trypoxylus dichotomus]
MSKFPYNAKPNICTDDKGLCSLGDRQLEVGRSYSLRPIKRLPLKSQQKTKSPDEATREVVTIPDATRYKKAENEQSLLPRSSNGNRLPVLDKSEY